jgi:hypothetical protein
MVSQPINYLTRRAHAAQLSSNENKAVSSHRVVSLPVQTASTT